MLNKIRGSLFSQLGEIYQPQSLLPIAFCGFEQLILTEIKAYTNQEFSSQTQAFQAFHHTGDLMKLRLLTAALISSSFLASSAFADEEYVEVTAPNECCQTPMPGTLGLIAGMTGAPAAASGGSVKDAALKMAVDRVAKQKKKAQEKKEAEKTELDKASESESAATAIVKEVGASFRDIMSAGERERFKYTKRNPDGSISEEFEYENCVPGGPANPNGIKCTEKKFEQFTDLDGMEKWAFTISVIQAKYNPKHYYANSRGYHPEVVDSQTFTIVFESEADLVWQLNRAFGI